MADIIAFRPRNARAKNADAPVWVETTEMRPTAAGGRAPGPWRALTTATGVHPMTLDALSAGTLLEPGAELFGDNPVMRRQAGHGVLAIRPLFADDEAGWRPTAVAVTVIEHQAPASNAGSSEATLLARHWVFSAPFWVERAPHALRTLAAGWDGSDVSPLALDASTVARAMAGGPPAPVVVEARCALRDWLVTFADVFDQTPPIARPWNSLGAGLDDACAAFSLQGFDGQTLAPFPTPPAALATLDPSGGDLPLGDWAVEHACASWSVREPGWGVFARDSLARGAPPAGPPPPPPHAVGDDQAARGQREAPHPTHN
ncbi:MAG: hypothetical protein ACFB2Z_05475, partial [Maricaulaceae bacterium]